MHVPVRSCIRGCLKDGSVGGFFIDGCPPVAPPACAHTVRSFGVPGGCFIPFGSLLWAFRCGDVSEIIKSTNGFRQLDLKSSARALLLTTSPCPSPSSKLSASAMLRIAGGRIISTRPSDKHSRRRKENQGPDAPAEDDTDSSGDRPPSTLGRRSRSTDSDEEGGSTKNLSWAPRKKPTRTDPLVSFGRHFGRTVHAFCRPFPLLKDGLARQLQIQAGILDEDDLSRQERREHEIFITLLELSPGLDSRVLGASPDELHYLADTISKGATGARADDTKSLKSVIIDWITPEGGALTPPLSRNVKTDRGFYHHRTGELLCPATLDWTDDSIKTQLRSGELSVTGDIWPAFLYRDLKFNADDPWEGLFKGKLLVSAYKHVFTSPSSVEQETRATRSGNAEIHGMKSVTIPSLAYISTLVRFSLSSSAVFCRNDRSTDSERFYKTIIEFLESPSEEEEVGDLLKWWNQRVFPSYHAEEMPGRVIVPSVIDKLREWRAKKAALSAASSTDIQSQETPGNCLSPSLYYYALSGNIEALLITSLAAAAAGLKEADVMGAKIHLRQPLRLKATPLTQKDIPSLVGRDDHLSGRAQPSTDVQHLGNHSPSDSGLGTGINSDPQAELIKRHLCKTPCHMDLSNLPTLHRDSQPFTSPEDALRAAISFNLQKDGASSTTRSRVKAVGSERRAAKTKAPVKEESDTDFGRLLHHHHDSDAKGTTREAGECASGVGESMSSGTRATPMLQTVSNSLLEGTPEAAASVAEASPSSNNTTSDAVMIMMSTTQATVCIVAALLTAAMLGAFTLWFTLAYEPFGYAMTFFSSAPVVRKQLRQAICRNIQVYLEAFIDQLEQARALDVLKCAPTPARSTALKAGAFRAMLNSPHLLSHLWSDEVKVTDYQSHPIIVVRLYLSDLRSARLNRQQYLFYNALGRIKH
ncbi:hypothetical protein NMY22_g9199 [Coprinellus aureogranulatus]|nr:hypothetical protein NMY22_g9199 [Coprinellus aureogranulatus]